MRMHEARGCVIYAGPTENDVALGEVYDTGNPAPGEMAKVWAASYLVMFPALATIRNNIRAVLKSCPDSVPAEIKDKLRELADLAASSLPVPTMGDIAEIEREREEG